MSDLELHFAGAAETVTGSKYLLSRGNEHILVDCGLFQGKKKLRNKNWRKPHFDPATLDAVLLTHGHLDHTGYLPRLVRLGFNGPIMGTPPTLDIAEIILRDSAKIQEEEARRANQKGHTSHDPAKPLYSIKDAEKAIDHFTPRSEDNWHSLTSSLSCRYRRAGHILGATFIEMKAEDRRITFSGDMGRSRDPLMYPPESPAATDVLLLESTYGDRNHPAFDALDQLETIIGDTVSRGGTILVPSFAVERAQLLMYLLWKLRKEDRIPQIPMYFDTPMGMNVTKLFYDHADWHRLNSGEWEEVTQIFEAVQTFSETQSIAKQDRSKLIIAGSGMVTGGRILEYLTYYLQDPDSFLLLAGYQAEGTRGRHLLEGAEQIKFHGDYWPVHIQVDLLDELSAHADQSELLNWCGQMEGNPDQVYLVHGEPTAQNALRVRLQDQFDWNVNIPQLHDTENIS